MISEFYIELTNKNNEFCRVKLLKCESNGDVDYYESCSQDFFVKVSLNHDMTVTHLLEKGKMIVDEDSDIELRVLEAAYEYKIRNLEAQESGLEEDGENEGANEDDIVSGIKPYDPKLIRVETKNFSIKMVDEMISTNEIDLSPDFQRRFVWDNITMKSRLIESLLLRIPIPVFYFSQNDEGLFQVVDGVQRLTVIHSFMNNEFKLRNLEYLKQCEGMWFKNPKDSKHSLDAMYTRRIEQTQLAVNVIDPQTPEEVKYDIFKRINTGGKALKNQEIRNCFSTTKTRELLRRLAKSDAFIVATHGSVKPTRMADEELVLRFVAFYLIDHGKSVVSEYKGGMDLLLDSTISLLNKNAEKWDTEIQESFEMAMMNAYSVFGDRAFRKSNFINKSLFLGITRVFSQYSCEEMMKKDIQRINSTIQNEVDNRNSELYRAISMATNDAKNIKYVYDRIMMVVNDA